MAIDMNLHNRQSILFCFIIIENWFSRNKFKYLWDWIHVEAMQYIVFMYPRFHVPLHDL